MDSALTLWVVRSRKRLIIDDALQSGGGAQDNPSSLGHAAATTSLAVLLAQGLVPEQAGEFGVTFSFCGGGGGAVLGGQSEAARLFANLVLSQGRSSAKPSTPPEWSREHRRGLAHKSPGGAQTLHWTLVVPRLASNRLCA
jgi:hypothetical protein